ncbi:hypothetical protein KVT40_005383 [Elsinoe batatas]|uniref:DUF7029 domain-containing protein n=1 Tax=Elsinoe batatas TaxID=2601811 RepID=A0A8K0L640_9PEZI|nr:hypothetical protein KVT40_005383 [Elsinoe batatas]
MTLAEPVTSKETARPVSLMPVVPTDAITRSLKALAPATNASLYYAGSEPGSSESMVAKINAVLQYDSVVLDCSAFVQAVSCSATQMTVEFNDRSAFQKAVSSWKAPFILISGSSTCGDERENSLFVVQSIKSAYPTITASGSLKDMQAVYKTMQVDLGTVNTTSSNTSTPAVPDCTSSTLSLPNAACGIGFDQALDDKLTYYTGNDSQILGQIAPELYGPITTTKLTKRNYWDDAMGPALQLGECVKQVNAKFPHGGQAADELLNQCTEEKKNYSPSRSGLLDSWFAALDAVLTKTLQTSGNVFTALARLLIARDGAGSGKNGVDFNSDFTLNKELPKAVASSPWGNQYRFFRWSANLDTQSHLKAAALDEIMSIKEKLLPGSTTAAGAPVNGLSVEVFCVDCSFRRNTKMTASVSLVNGERSTGWIDFRGDMTLDLYLGLSLLFGYTVDWETDTLQSDFKGVTIFKVLSLAPYFAVKAKASLEVKALGQALYGLRMKWPNYYVHIDLVDDKKSYATGFAPEQSNQKFTAWAVVGAGIAFRFPISVGAKLGLFGKFGPPVAMVVEPGLGAHAQYLSGQVPDIKVGNCIGFSWGIEFLQTVSLSIFKLKTIPLTAFTVPLIQQCVGLLYTGPSTTTTTTTTTRSTTTTTRTTNTTTRPTTTTTRPTTTTTTSPLTSTTTTTRPPTTTTTTTTTAMTTSGTTSGSTAITSSLTMLSLTTTSSTTTSSISAIQSSETATTPTTSTTSALASSLPRTTTSLSTTSLLSTSASTTSTETTTTTTSASATASVDPDCVPADHAYVSTDSQVWALSDPQPVNATELSEGGFTMTTGTSRENCIEQCVTIGNTCRAAVYSGANAACWTLVQGTPRQAPASIVDGSTGVTAVRVQTNVCSAGPVTRAKAGNNSSPLSPLRTTAENSSVAITDLAGAFFFTPSASNHVIVNANNGSSIPSAFNAETNLILRSVEKYLIYYPSVMAATGVSRLRLAPLTKMPQTASLVIFAGSSSPQGDVLLPIGGLQTPFATVACSLQNTDEVRFFLVPFGTTDVAYLKNVDLEETVFGDVVVDCFFVSMASKGVATLIGGTLGGV